MAEIGNEVPSANAARLPALGAPELSVEYLAKIKEIIEVVLGRRGSPWDRAVTFRDMNAGGLGGFIPGMTGATAALFNPATGQVTTEGGATFDIDAALRESAAYKDLLTRIGSTEELADLPEQISRQLEDALADVARARGNDIRSVETKLHNEQVSLAWRLNEVTASLHQTAAGARSYSAAFADSVRAVATRVEQVAADLEAAGGAVNVQEQITAIADAVEGLQGQWSLKIQTNPTGGQPPVIAGIALSVEDPIAGPGTSSLVFLADKVGFYTAGGTLNPFSISGNQVKMTNVIAQSLKVIMADGTVVLDAGKTLAQQTASNPNLVPGPMGWPTKYNGAYSSRNGNTLFGDGSFFGLPAAASAGTYIAVESPPCGIPANTAVTVSFDAYCDSGTRGLVLNFYGPNVDTARFEPTVNTTFTRYVWTTTMPNVADAPKAFLRMWSGAVGNQIIISNLKVELGAKATPWCDNVVTTDNARNRVSIPNLSVMSQYAGSIEIGPGGHIRQGMTDYNVGIGMWMGQHGGINKFMVGDPNGALMWWDGNTLQTKGLSITSPVYAAFTVSITGSTYASGGGLAVNFGTFGLTIAGSANVKSILWTLSNDDLNAGTMKITSGTTGTTATVRSNVPTSGNTNGGVLTATIIGLDGRITSADTSIAADHF